MLNWVLSLSATDVTSQIVATCCYCLNTSRFTSLLHKINSWYTIVEYVIFLSNVCTIFNTKLLLMSLPNAFIFFISFSNPSSSLTSSFKPFTYKWLIFPSVLCTWYPQSALFSLCVNVTSAIQKGNGERQSPWNISHHICMGCDCITSCFVLNEALCSISLLTIYKI